MSARSFFARAALFAYPVEFRSHFGDALVADIEDEPGAGISALTDMIAGGCAMRTDVFLRDVSYAVRRLRSAPLFVAVVVLAFALGIGANIAVFSVLSNVVLKPLPYLNPAGLVSITSTSIARPGQLAALSVLDVSDLRSQTKTLTGMAGVSDENGTILVQGKPTTLEGVAVMPAYFSTLGIATQLGRVLNASDTRPGVRSIVISDGMWRRFFGADPAAVGKPVTIDGILYQIVGITKPSQLFVLPAGSQITPLDYVVALDENVPQKSRGSRYIGAIARLAPGVTRDAADAELNVISRRLQALYPRVNAGFTFHTQSLSAAILGDAGSSLWTIFAAVIGILLIACANVANVLGARWSARGREFALRRALGATTARITAQLLVETGILATLGGLAGLLIAYGSIAFLRAGVLSGLPRSRDIRIDGASLLYAALIVVATTLLSGLVPVFLSNRADLHAVLKTAGRGGGSGGQRIRSALVIVEIALTLALVTVSGLMIRSFVQLSHTPLGIRTEGLYVTDLTSLPDRTYPTLASRTAMQRDVLQRLQSLPGVEDAALTVLYPLGDISLHFDTAIFGETYPPGLEPSASGNDVSPRYFATMGIRVVAGRSFTDRDSASAPPVAIVNQAFVRRYIRRSDAIGVRIRVAGWNGTKPVWSTIVGVVGDERQRLSQPAGPEIYTPIAQAPPQFLAATIYAPHVARTALAREVSASFASAAPAIEAPGISTIDERTAAATRSARSAATLLSLLAVVALLLSLTGVFGVVSFSVSQRLHEFGIRSALGAQDRSIFADVLSRVAVTTAIGITIGLALAAVSAQAISSLLHDISPFDPLTFGAVVALLFVSACVAALQPAVRATRVEPATALRYE